MKILVARVNRNYVESKFRNLSHYVLILIQKFSKHQHIKMISFRTPITFLQLVLTFLNTSFLFKEMGTEFYGFFSTLLAAANLLSPIISFGFSILILNYAANLEYRESFLNLVRLLKRLMILLVTLAFLMTLFALINLVSLNILLCFSLACLLCLNSLLWSVIASHGWWRISQFQFLLSSLAFTILLQIFGNDFSFLKIFTYQMISILFSLIFAIVIFSKLCKSLEFVEVASTPNKIENTTRFLVPFGLSLIYAFATQLDVLIVARLLNFSEVAKYQLGLQVFQPLSSVLVAVIFSTRSLYLRASVIERNEIFLKSQLSFLKLGSILFFLNTILASFFVPAISDGKVFLSWHALFFFAINGLFSTLAYSASLLHSQTHKLRWVFLLEIVCLLLINLPISILCTIFFGFVGPILGTITSNLVRIFFFNLKGKQDHEN